jgi:hypothetical protein
VASTRPSACTTVASPFTNVAGRNTTPLSRATVAPLAVPPPQNTFALLEAVDESPALAEGTVDDDAASTVDKYVAHTDGTPRAIDAAGPVNDDVVHTDTEGTPRADGDSRPLLNLAMITDPVVDTLTTHDRVLTTTIADITAADRALDLAITGVASALDGDDDNDTGAKTMASRMPMIPHGDVSAAPTMAAFMLVLQSLQAQNQAILTRLDSIDATNQQRHGELHAEITSKADSTDITRLDHLLADVTTQLTPVTASILDIKANLSHVMTTHAAKLDKLDTMIDDQQACMDSYSTSFNERFAALERLLSSPHPRARLWLIPPSEGATAQRANFLPQSCPRVVLKIPLDPTRVLTPMTTPWMSTELYPCLAPNIGWCSTTPPREFLAGAWTPPGCSQRTTHSLSRVDILVPA